jgi:calcineurin-like phosphoesterase family protein
VHFFTADEHYGHKNILRYCRRPFASAEEMGQELIRRHNEVVGADDTVIHAGDFTLLKKTEAEKYLRQLRGHHCFLRGSHDRWLGKAAPAMLELTIEGQCIVVCHYAMRVWPRSHYNSWQLFGHSHGKLDPVGKQWDIGVDNNNFYPVSFEQLRAIMLSRPDNPNLITVR